MEIREGYVEHIIFRNEDNGYTVMELSCEQEELTCVGTFQMIHEGEMLEVQGEFVEHSAYGRQLKVLSFTEKTPQDSMAMERYLG